MLPYDSIKLVHETSAENREVWVVNVNYIESETFRSGILEISEANRE
jgi:hypothetical protein